MKPCKDELAECPYCGCVMETGEILGLWHYSQLRWKPDAEKGLFSRWLSGHLFGEYNWLGMGCACGHRCNRCGKIIVDG